MKICCNEKCKNVKGVDHLVTKTKTHIYQRAYQIRNKGKDDIHFTIRIKFSTESYDIYFKIMS